MDFYSVHENFCLWDRVKRKPPLLVQAQRTEALPPQKHKALYGPFSTVEKKTPGESRPSHPASAPAMGRRKYIVLHHEAEEDTCRHRSLEGACSRGGSRQSNRVTGVSFIYAIRYKPPGSQLFPLIEIWRNMKMGVF